MHCYLQRTARKQKTKWPWHRNRGHGCLISHPVWWTAGWTRDELEDWRMKGEWKKSRKMVDVMSFLNPNLEVVFIPLQMGLRLREIGYWKMISPYLTDLACETLGWDWNILRFILTGESVHKQFAACGNSGQSANHCRARRGRDSKRRSFSSKTDQPFWPALVSCLRHTSTLLVPPTDCGSNCYAIWKGRVRARWTCPVYLSLGRVIITLSTSALSTSTVCLTRRQLWLNSSHRVT